MTSSDLRFREVYVSYFNLVHAYCRRRTDPDRAEDATAEVFLVAWRKIDQVPDGDGALPWLYRVAYGEVNNLWRGVSRQKRLREKLNRIEVEVAPSPEEYVVVNQEARLIIEAMNQIRKSHQEVLRLSVWEGLSGSDLAAALDVSADAAKQRLSRARRALVSAYNHLDKDQSSIVARKGGAW